MSATTLQLSNQDHMALFLGVLVVSGAMCPRCGYGTRVTSKRWARCKREGCGERVRRGTLPAIPPSQEVQRG